MVSIQKGYHNLAVEQCILYVSVFGRVAFEKEVCAVPLFDLYSLPRYVLPLFGLQMHLLQVGVVLAHVWYTP